MRAASRLRWASDGRLRVESKRVCESGVEGQGVPGAEEGDEESRGERGDACSGRSDGGEGGGRSGYELSCLFTNG